MVSCRDIHERISRGEKTTAEDRAHLDECESCRLLLADDARLGRALGEAPRAGLDLAGIRDAVREQIADETGPLAYLRSRTTLVRLAAAFAIAATVSLLVVLLTPRVDLDLYPSSRMAVALTLLALPTLGALFIVLRPLQRRALRGALVWAGLAVGVAVPWILALLPQAHALHPAALAGGGDDLMAFAIRCLAFGVAAGLPLLLALWALDRGAHAALRRALLAAAAAGLLGNLALQLHCPITAPSHLLTGHATVGVVLLCAYLLAALRGRML